VGSNSTTASQGGGEAADCRANIDGVRGPGRPQHKYLQDLIRRWAEDRGYTVTIEKPVLDALGIVDLVLERRGWEPIACEISVTTSPDHELQNAQWRRCCGST
jgi:hypothetical protein